MVVEAGQTVVRATRQRLLLFKQLLAIHAAVVRTLNPSARAVDALGERARLFQRQDCGAEEFDKAGAER